MSRSQQATGDRPSDDKAKPRKYTRHSDGTRRASVSSARSSATAGNAPAPSTHSPSDLPATPTDGNAKSSRLSNLQDALDTLYDEWMSVEIVFQSMQNAFPVTPLAVLSQEERLDDIDRELSIAYDDLMVQVRRIHRNLNRLSHEMAHFRATRLHNQLASSSSARQQAQEQKPYGDNTGRTTSAQ